MKMSKQEFLARWRSDSEFRFKAKQKLIRVIGDNVIFMNPDGTIKAVFGVHD